jgi:hypothetical protein
MNEMEYVEWLDHCSLGPTRTWQDLSDAVELTPVKMYSVGWVIKETKKYIIVVPTHNSSDHCYGEMLILKGCIVRRKILRKKKNKKSTKK